MRFTVRRMAPCPAPVIIALGAAACGMSSAPTSGALRHSVPCGPLGAETVAADGSARVYRVRTGRVGPRTLYTYDGCTGRRGKPVLLVARALNGDTADPETTSVSQDRPFSCTGPDCTWVRHVRLAGVKAGIIAEDYGLDSMTATLTVHDLGAAR